MSGAGDGSEQSGASGRGTGCRRTRLPRTWPAQPWLDLATSTWRGLPGSDHLQVLFTWSGNRLVDPEIFVTDGGQVSSYGRAIPSGGTLTLPDGMWGRLPDPAQLDIGCGPEAAGTPLSRASATTPTTTRSAGPSSSGREDRHAVTEPHHLGWRGTPLSQPGRSR